jgi:Mg2+/citrate symporter
LSGANAGFGIVFALIIVLIIAAGIVFYLNFSKVKKQREKMVNLKL